MYTHTGRLYIHFHKVVSVAHNFFFLSDLNHLCKSHEWIKNFLTEPLIWIFSDRHWWSRQLRWAAKGSGHPNQNTVHTNFDESQAAFSFSLCFLMSMVKVIYMYIYILFHGVEGETETCFLLLLPFSRSNDTIKPSCLNDKVGW